MLKSLSSLNLSKSASAQYQNGSTYSLNSVQRTSTTNHANLSSMVPKDSKSLVMSTRCSVTEKTATWSSAFPPSEGFFDAIVQYIEETDCDKRILWVTDLKYENSLRKLITEMNRSIDQKTPCKPDYVFDGALVAVPFDKILYRGVVLENKSEAHRAKVRLIDYGNAVQVPHSQIFPAIPIMSNLNAYAFRVLLPHEYGPVEIESILTIRIVGEKHLDGYYNVEGKMKSISLHLPLELLNSEPILSVVKCFPDNRNVLMRLINYSFDNQTMEDVLNSDQTKSFDFESEPNVGAFVAAKTSVGWRRSRLLGFMGKLHKYLVYAIDEGFITLSKQIMRVPNQFIIQPMSVFAITTKSPEHMLSEAMLSTAQRLTLGLLPTTSEKMNKDLKTKLLCSLKDNERVIVDVAFASVFTGSLNELDLKLWHEKIPEGSKVYISHVLTYKEIFIASCESKEYQNIFANESQKCLPFTSEDNIKLKDVVLACNTNGGQQYYRGQVMFKLIRTSLNIYL